MNIFISNVSLKKHISSKTKVGERFFYGMNLHIPLRIQNVYVRKTHIDGLVMPSLN